MLKYTYQKNFLLVPNHFELAQKGTNMSAIATLSYPSARIVPTDLFGNDADRLLAACEKAFDNALHKYKGCYRSPSRPTLTEVRLFSYESTLGVAYRAALDKWKADEPDEAAKEESSRKEWEMQRDKQFRIIYGIARRHHLHLHWHGNDSSSCPDQWTIYKNGKSIARIYCLC
jgi:hypothetical protein